MLIAISIYVMLRLSTRLYRAGILMYGKRATLPEMLRWVRYSQTISEQVGDLRVRG